MDIGRTFLRRMSSTPLPEQSPVRLRTLVVPGGLPTGEGGKRSFGHRIGLSSMAIRCTEMPLLARLSIRSVRNTTCPRPFCRDLDPDGPAWRAALALPSGQGRITLVMQPTLIVTFQCPRSWRLSMHFGRQAHLHARHFAPSIGCRVTVRV